MSRRPTFITTTVAKFRQAMARIDAEGAAIEWAARWEMTVTESERRRIMAEAITAVRASNGTPHPGPVAVALRRIVEGGDA